MARDTRELRLSCHRLAAHHHPRSPRRAPRTGADLDEEIRNSAKVRQRIEAVIDAAIAREVRSDDNNPACWLGLKAVLGKGRPTVVHHPAHAVGTGAGFPQATAQGSGLSAHALERAEL
jgi:hypothetical protein